MLKLRLIIIQIIQGELVDLLNLGILSILSRTRYCAIHLSWNLIKDSPCVEVLTHGEFVTILARDPCMLETDSPPFRSFSMNSPICFRSKAPLAVANL